MRVGQEAYWLDQIAHDRCEYYSGRGESPGWWVGSLAERVGLEGVAEEAAVHRLFAGQDPVTGEQRVAPLWRADPRSRWTPGPSRRRCGSSQPPRELRSASWRPVSGGGSGCRAFPVPGRCQPS